MKRLDLSTCSSGRSVPRTPLYLSRTSWSTSSIEESSMSSSSKARWPLSYSRAKTCPRVSLTFLSFCRRKTSPSLKREMTWLEDASMSKTSTMSSSPAELVTETRSARTMGLGKQVASGALSKSSMLRAPFLLKPVISPPSSMPMTSLPPDALAKALICLAISLSSLRALLRCRPSHGERQRGAPQA